jgi:hypothetical protein
MSNRVVKNPVHFHFAVSDNPDMPAKDDDADAYNARLRRRMLMARIEAGYGDNIADLRDRLVELGYVKDWGIEKLRALQSGQYSADKPRDIRPGEIKILAEACRVSPAFFHVDLAQLNEPGGSEEIERRVSKHEDQLRELREMIDALPSGDELREVVEGSRQVTQAFKSAADADAESELQPDSDTRDAADATPEGPEAPTAETPSTARKHAP